MWEYEDKQLAEYQKKANKTNKKIIDEFQNVFDRVKELNEDASNSDLKRFKNRIEDNMEYLTEYGQYQARKALKRRRIPYSYILWFDIFLIYAYQQHLLAILQQELFYNVVLDAYKKEIKGLSKYISIKELNVDKILNDALGKPNSKGILWNDYLDASTEYKANELYNKAIQVIRSNKPLDIYNPEFQKLLLMQNKRMLNINGNKTSGALDNQLFYLINEVKTQTYIFNGVEKCKFIAVHDKATTEMCTSLDGQVFNVHDWNKFKRYSASASGYVSYKVYGMVPGVNLPPIDDNFHYCRSTITYLLEKNIEEDTRSKLTGMVERANERS